MLIVGRFEGESIIIGEEIEIRVETLKKDKVMLAIDAPRQIPIQRKENCTLIAALSPESKS